MKFNQLITALILSVSIASYGQSINEKYLDSIFTKAYNDFETTGLSITIVKGDKIVLNKSYGYKDYNKVDKVDENSVFNIASCSKAFIAAALGKLVDDGKLRWNDKVIKYLPDFELSDPYITKEIDIRDILDHRSGLATFEGDILWYCTDYSDEQIIEKLRYYPIKKNFRSDIGYSNVMYIVAGEIINKISGLTWEEYLKKELFTPLEMHDSYTSVEKLDEIKNIAYPHVNGEKPEIYKMRQLPAGSIFSTSHDLSNWMIMLINNGEFKGKQILSKKTINELFTSQVALIPPSNMKELGTHFYSYCLGWNSYDMFGKKIVEHEGGYPGYEAIVSLVPEDKLGIYLLCNDFNFSTEILLVIKQMFLENYYGIETRDWITDYVEEKKTSEIELEEYFSTPHINKIEGTQPSLNLSEYCGVFKDKIYGKAKISMVNDELNLVLLPTKEKFNSILEHWHYDTFRFKFKEEFLPYGFITFEFNSKGKVTGFKLDLPSDDFNFKDLKFKKI
jgi:CubicO group peptidase (beta-lactamase class C family)